MFATAIQRRRSDLGLSQVALASAAGVSLATVQNVEAGRANPSLDTLRRLLAPLGLGLALERIDADWDALAAHGLPLAPLRDLPHVRPDADTLAALVRLAAADLAREGGVPDRERRAEAFAALLLALHNHFPKYFRTRFGRAALVRSHVPATPSGRVIKLHRIALAAVAEYL